MTNPSLLASAALFRSLYDNKKDIYDVISEFIRAYIILNSKWAFNATDCTNGVNETFGFDIPEAVIKTCLRNRLKKSGELSLKDGVFSVTSDFDKNNNIQSELNSSQGEYEEVTQKLIEHAQRYTVDNIDTEKLLNCLSSYLLNKNIPEDYLGYIAHFILKNENNPLFKEKLNRIEEGIILYTGIQYSPDLSYLGNWRGDLSIYLDTEHLFSATGLNGILYKQVFDDFYELIQEINFKKRKGGKISLRYFQETKNEVDSFFYAAEKIFETGSSIDPSKTAMINIINGCVSSSDILEKKTKFESGLLRLKIQIEEFDNYYEYPEYNVEGSNIIENLKDRYNNVYDENVFSNILKIFTKINNLRKGVNKVAIDRISAIFLTENGLTKSVAFAEEVFDGKGCIPYATNIEFLTERMWFKLNKGFGKGKSIPRSFDVITKAKLVLSSQVNNAVSEEYRKLNKKYKNGEIDDKSTALLISELRLKQLDPEVMQFDKLDESLEFMSNKFIENSLREKSALEKRAKEGDSAKAELKELKLERKKENVRPFKCAARRRYRLLQIVIFGVVPIFVLYILYGLYSDNDTKLSIFFGIVTLTGFVVSTIKAKSINKYLWRLSRKFYKKSLNVAFQRTSR